MTVNDFKVRYLKTDREINKIIFHCSATREGQDIKMETIRNWHVKDNGWSDIGYHFVIELDGDVIPARDINRTGSHAKGFNTGSIGICYVGGCDKDMRPKDTKTKAQNTSIAALIIHLQELYPQAEFLGHCDLPNVKKACPSFSVKEFLNNIHENLFR